MTHLKRFLSQFYIGGIQFTLELKLFTTYILYIWLYHIISYMYIYDTIYERRKHINEIIILFP
jgi:hypothetical protein